MKKEVLEINMERFDSYIEKLDVKASFILAIASAILAAILIEYKSISNDNCFLKVLLVISIIFIVISTIFSILVIIPRKSISNFKSCLYYKSVAEMSKDEYKVFLNTINNQESFEKELINETKELANICNQKMIKCEKSSFFLVLGLGIILLIELINIIKF
ncbi:Pycsar system effector family protein [Clostridium nigeriense]|uniref:Pycsar system effector family protein n=1 Tax=Clostridium nigeriense TaxID=1805470 RepID=UPI003D3582B3